MISKGKKQVCQNCFFRGEYNAKLTDGKYNVLQGAASRENYISKRHYDVMSWYHQGFLMPGVIIIIFSLELITSPVTSH